MQMIYFIILILFGKNKLKMKNDYEKKVKNLSIGKYINKYSLIKLEIVSLFVLMMSFTIFSWSSLKSEMNWGNVSL